MNTMAQASIPQFIVELEDAFNKAMVSNDVEQIARCITDDWILVTPVAGPIPRSRILGVIGYHRPTRPCAGSAGDLASY